jgi:release factor glutamine methyltransferase
MPRMKLYLNFERPLVQAELSALRGMVKRRGEREPLQHIIGSTSFCGLEIAVNRDVLVPRPETELLAEEAWKFLSTLNPQPSTVLDFGTGSGCLALAIAAKCPQVMVHAIDISDPALKVASDNALRLGLANRVLFHAGDGFGALRGEARFDLIISNPPYVPSAQLATLEPEVRDYDPRLALDGGADGLGFYRRLAAEAGLRLEPRGKLMLELGDGQGRGVSELLTQHGWTVEGVLKDYSARERILIARRGD